MIYLILFSAALTSQTFHAEYTGISRLKARVAVTADSSTLATPDILSLMAADELVLTYNLHVYASKDYLYCEEEITSGSLMGVSMKGEVFKYFIDLKKLVGYSYNEHLKIKVQPQNIGIIKHHGNTYHVTVRDGSDTAVIFFDTLLPKELTGSVVLLQNSHGVSALKSYSNEFSIQSWEQKSYDFEKELKFIHKTNFKEVERPFNLVFRAKYQQ